MRDIHTHERDSGGTGIGLQKTVPRQSRVDFSSKMCSVGKCGLQNKAELMEADLSVMTPRAYSLYRPVQSYVQRLRNTGGESALSLRAGHSTNELL
jgi:hypothetical protein